MLLCVLEDNDVRAAAMRKAAASLGVDIVVHETAPAAIAWLAEHLARCAVVSLDHDLGPDEAGDGRDVAAWLAGARCGCPVIVHTSNAPAATSMILTLEDAGCTVARVVPLGDDWVARYWSPTVQRALSAH